MTCRCEAFCASCGVHVADTLEMLAFQKKGCKRCGAKPGDLRRIEAKGNGRTFNPTIALTTGDGQRVCVNCLRGELSGHAWVCDGCGQAVPSDDDGLPAVTHPHGNLGTSLRLRCVVTFN